MENKKFGIKNKPKQPELNDDFQEIFNNFESMKVKEEKSPYQEILTENMKNKSIKYNNNEFYLCFIAYSNINFFILSNQKRIGNLYEAEVEEPEFQIDQEE